MYCARVCARITSIGFARGRSWDCSNPRSRRNHCDLLDFDQHCSAALRADAPPVYLAAARFFEGEVFVGAQVVRLSRLISMSTLRPGVDFDRQFLVRVTSSANLHFRG